MITLVYIVKGFANPSPNPITVPTASGADAIASAQSLRITRKLWKAAKPQQNNSSLQHISEEGAFTGRTGRGLGSTEPECVEALSV
jgi:hypothetical protein